MKKIFIITGMLLLLSCQNKKSQSLLPISNSEKKLSAKSVCIHGNSNDPKDKIIMLSESCLKNKVDSIQRLYPLVRELTKNIFFKKLTSKDTVDLLVMNMLYDKIKCTYLNENDTIVTDDISLWGKEEYHCLPSNIYRTYKIKWYKVCKIQFDKNHYGLLSRFFDLDSSRYFLFLFDNNNTIKSSICLFGYNTSFESEKKNAHDFYDIKDSMSFENIYLKSTNISKKHYSLYIKGSHSDAKFVFTYHDGMFRLDYQKEYPDDDTPIIIFDRNERKDK